MIDQMPQAPVNMVMPAQANHLVLVINGVLLLAVAALMLRDGWKTRSFLPVFCLLGGAIASLMEPLFDVMICVWYPQYGQTPLYRFFNISVPYWLLPAYMWTISGQGYLMYRKFQSGISMNQLWLWYLFFYAVDLFLEGPGLMLHIYDYYGPQPMKIFGLPLWMAATNAVMFVLVGAAYRAVQEVLRGPRIWIATALVPVVVGASQISAGWPVWLAFHSGQGVAFTTAASFVTIGISVMITYLVGLYFCVPARAAVKVPAFGRVI